MIQQLKKYFRNPGWYNTMGMWWGSILYWGTFKSVIPCLGPTLRPVKLGSLGCVAWALVSLKNLHEILMLFINIVLINGLKFISWNIKKKSWCSQDQSFWYPKFKVTLSQEIHTAGLHRCYHSSRASRVQNIRYAESLRCQGQKGHIQASATVQHDAFLRLHELSSWEMPALLAKPQTR